MYESLYNSLKFTNKHDIFSLLLPLQVHLLWFFVALIVTLFYLSPQNKNISIINSISYNSNEKQDKNYQNENFTEPKITQNNTPEINDHT